MPRPTAWPMVLAASVFLLFAGLVTSLVFSGLGIVLFVIALAGWVHELKPGVGVAVEPLVPSERRREPIEPSKKRVEQLRADMPGYRIHLPEAVHPYSAGVKSGLAGGAVMAVVAVVYGVVSGKGIWYPINLLAAMLLPSIANLSPAEVGQFHAAAFIAGLAIHAAASILVGLFFAMLLPALPRSPLIWGGLVAPVMWSAAIYAFMDVLNPVMNSRVDWPWFIASQFAFGLTMGLVIMRAEKIPARGFGSARHRTGSDADE